MPPKPYPQSYWVEPGKLLAGEYMGPDALIRLRELWKDCSKWPVHDSPQTRAQCEYVVTWRESR